MRDNLPRISASYRPAPTNSASRSCSRVSAHSNSDTVAGCRLLLRHLGLSGSAAMNFGEENRDSET